MPRFLLLLDMIAQPKYYTGYPSGVPTEFLLAVALGAVQQPSMVLMALLPCKLRPLYDWISHYRMLDREWWIFLELQFMTESPAPRLRVSASLVARICAKD